MSRCSWDLDDIFAYRTGVRVRIRHSTLGGLYYAVMLSILIGYVGVYEFWIKEMWGEIEELKGSLRASAEPSSFFPPVARFFPRLKSIFFGHRPILSSICDLLKATTTPP